MFHGHLRDFAENPKWSHGQYEHFGSRVSPKSILNAKFEKRHYFPKITASDPKANLAKKSILAINMFILAINIHILNMNKHILNMSKHILAI